MIDIKSCNLCPRNCGVNREINKGFCESFSKTKIAKYMLHHWEEPCISGEKGSGAVFFSGCNLKCVFCQNYKISTLNNGYEISLPELCDIFLKLQDEGACNINLVTPTHYAFNIIKALDMVKGKLNIPVVYNCGGYESVETLKALSGYIDIYLQDIKYSDNSLAIKYSRAPLYFEASKKATEEMIKQRGKLIFSDDGLLKSGVIIRHLVLPKHKSNTYGVLEFIKTLDKDKYLISLMSQFTPTPPLKEMDILNKKVGKMEYELIMNKAMTLGIDNGYFQDISSATDEYIPDF